MLDSSTIRRVLEEETGAAAPFPFFAGIGRPQQHVLWADLPHLALHPLQTVFLHPGLRGQAVAWLRFFSAQQVEQENVAILLEAAAAAVLFFEAIFRIPREGLAFFEAAAVAAFSSLASAVGLGLP